MLTSSVVNERNYRETGKPYVERFAHLMMILSVVTAWDKFEIIMRCSPTFLYSIKVTNY